MIKGLEWELPIPAPTMLRTDSLIVISCATALGACAAAVPGFIPSSGKPSASARPPPVAGALELDGHYALSPNEQKFNCKKINGSIEIGILQLREAASRHHASLAAKSMQGVFAPVSGGSSYGLNVDAETARSRARLEALNARLAEKKCPTYDLTAELAPGNNADPAPVKPNRRQ